MTTPKTPFSTRQKIIFTAIITFVFLLLVVLIGEIIIRSFFKKEYGRPPRAVEEFFHAEKDPRLGWKIRPNYELDWRMKDKAGVQYDLSIRFNEHGFKAFGDTLSNKPKVFFIGDSYTASSEVSNEKSFFNLLKDSIDIEVFALGVGGYGTMQEYLVLDEWVDKIKPDLVVLEVCNNDFIDNTPEMERLAAYKVSERRPYLDSTGQIFYERPITVWEICQRNIYFFKWVDVKWKGLTSKITGKEWHPAEHYISNMKMEYEPFHTSAKITDSIILKMKKRLPQNTKILAFNADCFDPQAAVFRNIFASYDIPYSEEPARLVLLSDQKGETTFAQDGYHWNERGHELISEGLAPEVRKLLFGDD